LLANSFLQFQAEPVLFHFEHGKIVFPHQIDDCFNVFEFHGGGMIEPLGNPRSPSRSRREIGHYFVIPSENGSPAWTDRSRASFL
jgi:hypothetical protein